MNANRSDQLHLLSIFHYIFAVFVGLLSLMPLIHIIFGALIMSNTFFAGQPKAPPAALGWLFVVIGAIFMLIGFSYAALVALAGRFLSQRRHWMFCMVVAGLSCAFFPVGTVLGVFTIFVLSQPEVRVAFQPTDPAPALAERRT